MAQEIHICDYIAKRKDSDVIVDLREKRMYDFGTIEGAVNIPLDDIAKLYSLPKDKDIYVFCQAGEISPEIAELLCDAGYNAYDLAGGYREYLRKHIAKNACETCEAKGDIK